MYSTIMHDLLCLSVGWDDGMDGNEWKWTSVHKNSIDIK